MLYDMYLLVLDAPLPSIVGPKMRMLPCCSEGFYHLAIPVAIVVVDPGTWPICILPPDGEEPVNFLNR